MVKKRDEPCPRDGWPYPGFHVCLDLSNPIYRRVEDGLVRDSEGMIVPQTHAPKTEEHKKKISLAQRERIEMDPKRIERNKEIIRLYSEERLSMAKVAQRMELNPRTVSNVLKVAAGLDLVIIRKYNLRSDTEAA